MRVLVPVCGPGCGGSNSGAVWASSRAREKALVVAPERTEMTDEGLLGAIAGGDREAFAALFAIYAPRVKSYLLRLGAGAAAAEDLAQDAMVALWRRAAPFR